MVNLGGRDHIFCPSSWLKVGKKRGFIESLCDLRSSQNRENMSSLPVSPGESVSFAERLFPTRHESDSKGRRRSLARWV